MTCQRFILLAILVISSYNICRSDDTLHTLTADNIEFNYSMIDSDSDSTRPDCIGTLSLDVKLPPNSKRIQVNFTREHLMPSDRHFLSIKFLTYLNDSITEFHFERDGLSWGTYFQVAVFDYDGTVQTTPLYCTNDYMAESDLEQILGFDSIDDVTVSGASIIIGPNNLTISTGQTTDLSIYSINGKMLYAEKNNSLFEIPLSQLNSGLIIIRYTINNQFITKKLILR